jgi:hypothetical protein
MERPRFIQTDHLEYLDDLREDGSINMYGATDYLISDWGLSRHEARETLKYWMATYGKEDR